VVFSWDVIFNEQKFGQDLTHCKFVYLEHSDEPIDTNNLPWARRSECERKQIKVYGQRWNVTDIKEPKSVSEAQTSQK